MLLQQADDRVSISREWFPQYGFRLVDTIEKLKKLVDICLDRGIYSIDLETTGVDNRIYQDEYFEDGKKTRHGMRTVDRVVGICMSFDGQNGYYIPLSHEPEDSGNLPWDPAWDEISRLVNSKAKAIFHNKKFDAEFLYPLVGKEYYRIEEHEDTMLLARIINPIRSSPAGLKPLAKIHFGIDMVEIEDLFTQEKKDQLRKEKKHSNFALLHPREGLEYGCSDGIFTYKLWFALKDKLQGHDMMMYNLEKSFCNVVQRMERNRVHIDVDRVKQLAVECDAMLKLTGDTVRGIIEGRTGKTGKWRTLNVGSPKQLSMTLLTDPEGLQLKPTKFMLGDDQYADALSNNDDEDDEEDDGVQKQYTLKDEALQSMETAYGKDFKIQREGVVDKDGKPRQESIFDLILEYRHYQKMKGSYIDNLMASHDKYGDVRPVFNQMGTDTTRMSSKAGKIADGFSGINFQGIPRDSDDNKPELFKQIRTCIIPRPGWFLVKLDYSGEELRVVTNLSGDPIWTKSFLYEDGDVHSITSRTLFGKSEVSKDERNRGKRCNFAFIYGGGAGAISRNVGCSIEDGSRHMSNLRTAVPVLMGYVEIQKEFAKKHKCIFTAFGRRIPIPTIDSPIRAIRAKAERCAINYTIQATSADILKFALCLVDKKIRELRWEDRVQYVMTVHDEVVYEVKPEHLMEIVRKLDEWMTFPWKLPKAHGRDWEVPLMTEPGIDVNWKARFDYFKMVDGVPVSSKDIVDGEFKGKLKKDEYYSDGKVYQKIPEFLASHIHRADGQQASTQANPAIAKPAPFPVSVPTPEPVLPPSETEASKLIDPPSKTVSLDMDFGGEIETGLGVGVEERSESHQEEPPARPIEPSEVFRWVFVAVPSESVMKKLHAACILAEGPTPIRVINQKGEVLIGESERILVDVAKFRVLTELFGI